MYNHRLYEIIYILLSRKKVTCDELGEYLEVSRHTIMRDIETLAAAGVPVYMEKGRNGGIHLFQKVPQDIAEISQEEQQAVLASLQGLSMLCGAKGSALLEKLQELLNQTPSRVLSMDFGNWRQAAEDEDKFGRIQGAILNRQVIRFEYIDTYGKIVRLQVEPMLLWLEEGVWYLRGYCIERQGYRLYKLMRMQRVEVKEEKFSRSMPLLAENGEGKAKTTVALRLKISGSRRDRVYEEFEEEQIKEDEAGNYEVRVEYPEGEWLYDFLLSFGKDLQVIEPERMAERIKEMSEGILGVYRKDGEV